MGRSRLGRWGFWKGEGAWVDGAWADGAWRMSRGMRVGKMGKMGKEQLLMLQTGERGGNNRRGGLQSRA